MSTVLLAWAVAALCVAPVGLTYRFATPFDRPRGVPVSFVTLPLPVFLLVLAAVAVGAGLLVAVAAERLTRVRVDHAHGERHRRGQPSRHDPAPFVPGAVQELHRRAADLAAREAVRPARPEPPNRAALLHVHPAPHQDGYR